jgi:hypothetical protein|tara:strand:+ start:186 stop:473 length:288 start_codon:yes stop_codon:yes gene_type:complete
MKPIFGIIPHSNVVNLPIDHTLHIKNVKEWYIYNDKLAKKYANLCFRDKTAKAKQLIHEGYVKEIRHYLRHGDWISDFLGRDQEFPTRRKVIAGP